MCLLAWSAAALAAPPPISGLASSTHPDPTKWYSNSYPAFHWRPAIGAAGYSWWLDQYPTTVPDATAEIGGFGFAPKSDHSTGAKPMSVTVGDFNDDGKQDLATADWTADTASVLLGDGAGGFAPKTAFATGDSPASVAVGDFNGDGKQDLATANQQGWSVSVLLGDGAGGFAPKTDFGTDIGPESIAVGDFNDDGKQDLATADANVSKVSVLIGDGDGTFAARTDFASGWTPYSVAVGDFNGDGKQDLATANANGGTAGVLLGNGDGTFAGNVDFAAGSAPWEIAVGDFDGDGKQDLVTANAGDDSVSVLLNTTSGGVLSFHAKADFTTGDSPYTVAVGDFNGDGRQDLVAGNGLADTASVLLGDGAGGFAPKTDYGTGSLPIAVAVGDLNADGRQDLVTADALADTVSVLLNTTPDAAAAFGPRGDGVWYFHICTVDGVGGQGATSHVAVQIDTAAPITCALAAASVKRGRTAKLKYEVDDARPGSPTATVVIRIKNSRGKVVKTLKVGVKNVNVALVAKFTCRLPKGKYRYYVYATDQAGNLQSAVGRSTLRVK